VEEREKNFLQEGVTIFLSLTKQQQQFVGLKPWVVMLQPKNERPVACGDIRKTW
jgi:hypothetical protein